jgi:dienelactone hydrolase
MYVDQINDNQVLKNPFLGIVPSPTVKPLLKYSFENLKNTKFFLSEITLGKIQKEETNYISRMFYFETEGKKVSGLINYPKKSGNYPILVLLRGFVDREIYSSGEGSRRAGETFASNGFIALAPDFLGYGESASPSALPIEERFQTYTTVLSLLSSIPSLNDAFDKEAISTVRSNGKVGLWGHSNGGHIALSIAAITQNEFPLVLWAPVSKPFPYSILYFTDEFEDHGKALRKVVADFEKDYDIEDFSPTNYYEWIKSSIQIHQGGADEAVPLRWSDELYNNLKKLGIKVEYFTYPAENHNFNNGSFDILIERSLKHFQILKTSS